MPGLTGTFGKANSHFDPIQTGPGTASQRWDGCWLVQLFLFLRPLLTYASPEWFPFPSVTNIAKLERLHRATSRAISCCLLSSPILFSPRRLYLPYESPWIISLFYLISGPFVSQPLFPFQVWPDLEWNQDSADRTGELLRPLTHTCFVLLLLERLSFLAFPHLLGTCLLSMWNLSFPLHPLALIPLSLSSRCGSSSPWLSPALRSGELDKRFCFFSFWQGWVGVLANCSLCGTEAILFFSAGQVCSSFSAEACAILHALCWSRQHQQVCHF